MFRSEGKQERTREKGKRKKDRKKEKEYKGELKKENGNESEEKENDGDTAANLRITCAITKAKHLELYQPSVWVHFPKATG